eukprot:3092064-Rhodomonas_salina.3
MSCPKARFLPLRSRNPACPTGLPRLHIWCRVRGKGEGSCSLVGASVGRGGNGKVRVEGGNRRGRERRCPVPRTRKGRWGRTHGGRYRERGGEVK